MLTEGELYEYVRQLPRTGAAESESDRREAEAAAHEAKIAADKASEKVPLDVRLDAMKDEYPQLAGPVDGGTNG